MQTERTREATTTSRPITPSLSRTPLRWRGRPHWGRADSSEIQEPLLDVTCSFKGELAGLPTALGVRLRSPWVWEIQMPKERNCGEKQPDSAAGFTIQWTTAAGTKAKRPPPANLHPEIVGILADLVVAEIVSAKEGAR